MPFLALCPPGRTLLLLVLTLLPACDSFLDPDGGRRIGVIAFYSDPVTIHTPDTVQLGVPFEVSVRTYGDGCLREGPTNIRVRGLQIDVTPYDIHSGGRVCEAILNMFPHKATLALPTPGLARFLFYGKQEPDNLPITVGREVYVEG